MHTFKHAVNGIKDVCPCQPSMPFKVRFNLGDKLKKILNPRQCHLIIHLDHFSLSEYNLSPDEKFQDLFLSSQKFQWGTRTIHTLQLLVKYILSAFSETQARTGKSEGSLQETIQKCALKWETEYIIPAHSQTKEDFIHPKPYTAT